jgi:hypothetical protein
MYANQIKPCILWYLLLTVVNQERQIYVMNKLIKVKIELSTVLFLTEQHYMKAYWGSEGVTPRILDHCALEGGEWSASRPDRFTPKERAFGHGSEEKNSQPLPTLETLTIQPIVQRYTAELFRLQ